MKSTKNYKIYRTNDNYETVKATDLEIDDNCNLIFKDGNGVVACYRHNCWFKVVQ